MHERGAHEPADRERLRERTARTVERTTEVERAAAKATIDDLFGLLSRAYALPVLREFAFADGPLRFNELQTRLDVSPTTLSNRLSELSGAGLLRRRSYAEIPPRVEYEASEKADALAPVFVHLFEWGLTHDLDGGE